MMECATVPCDPDDVCTMLRSGYPRARKEHRCHECKRIISVGEKYLSETVFFDKEISIWKTCLDCESIRKAFFSEGFFFGETRWMLNDHIRECSGEISEITIAGLTATAREMVCSMIQQAWEDAFNVDDQEEAA